jgi:hypothetical protein
MAVANTPAYYDMTAIMAVKMFYGEGPGPNAIKNCRAFLQITLYFVTIGIKAQNNFSLQFYTT